MSAFALVGRQSALVARQPWLYLHGFRRQTARALTSKTKLASFSKCCRAFVYYLATNADLLIPSRDFHVERSKHACRRLKFACEHPRGLSLAGFGDCGDVRGCLERPSKLGVLAEIADAATGVSESAVLTLAALDFRRARDAKGYATHDTAPVERMTILLLVVAGIIAAALALRWLARRLLRNVRGD